MPEIQKKRNNIIEDPLPPPLPLVDSGLAMAASNGGLSSLRRLVVSYCPGVGDSGLRAVLGGCLTLRELSAGGCPEVTSAPKCYHRNLNLTQPPEKKS